MSLTFTTLHQYLFHTSLSIFRNICEIILNEFPCHFMHKRGYRLVLFDRIWINAKQKIPLSFDIGNSTQFYSRCTSSNKRRVIIRNVNQVHIYLPILRFSTSSPFNKQPLNIFDLILCLNRNRTIATIARYHISSAKLVMVTFIIVLVRLWQNFYCMSSRMHNVNYEGWFVIWWSIMLKYIFNPE